MNKGFLLGGLGGGSTLCCCTAGPAMYACGTMCSIPATTLTLNYVNALTGNGTTPLAYNAASVGGPTWSSTCFLPTGFTTSWFKAIMQCVTATNTVTFSFQSYSNNTCTTGIGGCTSAGATPHHLLLTSMTCGASFNAVWNTGTGTQCTDLYPAGWLTFTVTV